MKKLYIKGIFHVILLLLSNTLASQIVVLDPGHGYDSGGGNPDGRTATEIETALEVGLRTRTLIQNNCTWTVYMTRTVNIGGWSSVTARAAMSDNWNADRFLSIHCNAGGGTGTETFYCTNNDANTAPDIAFANEVQAEMVTNGSWTNRRCVEDNGYIGFHLGVLSNSAATGCLNEIGFVDFASDAAKLLDNTWRNNFATAYYEALQDNLGQPCTGGGVLVCSNDNCGAAVSLTSNASCPACSVDYATADGFTVPSCDAYTPQANISGAGVFFKFTAVNATQTITVDPASSGASALDPVVVVYTGSCSTLQEFACIDNGNVGVTESLALSGLNAGTVYTVRVYDYGAIEPPIGEGGFSICLTHTPCTYSISPSSQNFTSNGSSGSFAVTAGSGCPWTATSTCGWVTTTSSASGAGTVNFNVAANTGAQRSCTISVAGQTSTVTQDAAPCTYSINPSSQNFTSNAGSGSFLVSASSHCAWTASASCGWVTTTSSASGSGTVNFTVAANTGAQRSCSISVAGQTFTVTQDAAPCTYSISPSSQNFTSNAGSGSFSVTSSNHCAWTASASCGWLTTTSSGSGSGIIIFNVDTNAGAERTCSLSVDGQTFTVTQDAAPCTYSISPDSLSFTASGGSDSFAITADSHCAWTASTSCGWVTTTSSGSGSGIIIFNVDANTGAQRTCTISVAGQSFTVTQDAAPCTYSVSPPSQNFTSNTGSGSFIVSASNHCAWTASVSCGWITTTSSGSGSGIIIFNVDTNIGAQRTCSLTAAGQTLNIIQDAAPCTYSISPDSLSFTASGGSNSFAITAGSHCAWTAASGCSWLQTNSTGTGIGTVTFDLDSNSTPISRSCEITVNGQALTVIQEAAPIILIADFYASQTAGCPPLTVQFFNTSIGSPTTYLWDFYGSGVNPSTDTVANPTVTYSQQGVFTVKLTIATGGSSDAEIKTSYIDAGCITGINQNEETAVMILPNPSNGNFNLSFETRKMEQVQIKVFNILGQLIKAEVPLKIAGRYIKEINLCNVAKGIYVLQLNVGSDFVSRMIEVN